MATVNLGRIKPVFRGAYSGSTAYVVDDIVTHSDETFICIQAHGAGTQATSQTAYWTKLAAKGTDGTDVGTTITTQGDILYRDGSGLQRLAAGTSGQFLKTQGSGSNPVWGDVSGAFLAVTKVYESSTSNYFSNQSGTTLSGTTQYPVGARIGGAFTKQSATSKLLISGRFNMMHTNTNVHGSVGWIVGDEANYVSIGEDARAYGWYSGGSGMWTHDYSFIKTGIGAGSKTAYYAPAVQGSRNHTHELNPNQSNNSIGNQGDAPNKNTTSFMLVYEFE